MSLIDMIFNNTLIYRLWQAPFVKAKLEPVMRTNDFTQIKSILDIGCGPGTNTSYFKNIPSYLGIDINADYITFASNKHQRSFQVADITKIDANELGTFDFILLNSFLHHINDSDTAALLEILQKHLSPGGRIHVIDMILPEQRNLANLLARLDRGDYPRLFEHWLKLLEKNYCTSHCEKFSLKIGPLTPWNMFYFRGEARNEK